MQAKHGAHLLSAAYLELAQSAPLPDPAKHLLDSPAGIDRFAVDLVTRGAAIDGGTTGAIRVLSDVQRDTDAAHLSDKVSGVLHRAVLVLGRVPTDSLPWVLGFALPHLGEVQFQIPGPGLPKDFANYFV
jgi:hypothetical protein